MDNEKKQRQMKRFKILMLVVAAFAALGMWMAHSAFKKTLK